MIETRKRLLAVLVLCGLVLLAWTQFAPRAEAIIINGGKTAVYPLFGMPQGTVARLNVVNIGNPNIATACALDLKFFSDRGVEIALKRVVLEPGQSDFLQIGDPTALPGRARVYRRAEAGFIAPPEPEIPPGPCLGSLEVIENLTGRTMIFMGDGSVIPNP